MRFIVRFRNRVEKSSFCFHTIQYELITINKRHPLTLIVVLDLFSLSFKCFDEWKTPKCRCVCVFEIADKIKHIAIVIEKLLWSF